MRAVLLSRVLTLTMGAGSARLKLGGPVHEMNFCVPDMENAYGTFNSNEYRHRIW